MFKKLFIVIVLISSINANVSSTQEKTKKRVLKQAKKIEKNTIQQLNNVELEKLFNQYVNQGKLDLALYYLNQIK
jgi:hypothetical protein